MSVHAVISEQHRTTGSIKATRRGHFDKMSTSLFGTRENEGKVKNSLSLLCVASLTVLILFKM